MRALEHAAARAGGLRAGDGVATQRLGRASRLRVVDVLLTGTHEPGTSHYELLRAFVGERTLARIDAALEAATTARTSSATRCGSRASGLSRAGT